MTYQEKDFTRLLGIHGFSETLMENHFKLYQGYVNNTNSALDKLQSLATETPEFAEISRRLGWEFNGMRLHELYFDNMSKNSRSLDAESSLASLISKQFGSFEAWQKDFVAKGSIRGIGWVILYFDPEQGQLINTWINEHDLGHLAGAKPLLVMDVFEHSFITDFGLKKAEYIDAFLKTIDWGTVSRRFEG